MPIADRMISRSLARVVCYIVLYAGINDLAPFLPGWGHWTAYFVIAVIAEYGFVGRWLIGSALFAQRA